MVLPIFECLLRRRVDVGTHIERIANRSRHDVLLRVQSLDGRDRRPDSDRRGRLRNKWQMVARVSASQYFDVLLDRPQCLDQRRGFIGRRWNGRIHNGDTFCHLTPALVRAPTWRLADFE